MPIFEICLNTFHWLKKFWSNFTETLSQVFNFQNSLALSILRRAKLNRNLRFFFFFINASLQWLCCFIKSRAAVLLIAKKKNYIYIFDPISGWLFPSSLKEYLYIWFAFVIIRIFNCLIFWCHTSSLQNLNHFTP